MRVCLLSTYLPQRCGIATYTAALARALADDGQEPPHVISEFGAFAGNDQGVTSWPAFSRHQDFGPAVVEQALKLSADVVHVQHSPDILGMDKRLLRLLQTLRAKRIATVVTLHTVHNPQSAAIDRRFGVSGFHCQLADATDALIVHGGPAMSAELVRQGVTRAKIREIAHGTPAFNTVNRADARQRLGLAQDAKVLLFFGFIHPQKNLHTVLLAMNRVRRCVPNVLLYVAGSLQNRSWFNRIYLNLPPGPHHARVGFQVCYFPGRVRARAGGSGPVWGLGCCPFALLAGLRLGQRHRAQCHRCAPNSALLALP